MDTSPIENLSEVNRSKKKRLKRNKKKKATIKDEVQSMDQTTMHTRSTKNLLDTDLTVQPVADNQKMDAGPVTNLSEGNANKEKKESPERNKEKKTTIKDEIQSMNQSIIDTRVIKIGLKTDLIVQPLADNLKMDADSIETLSEGKANIEKKKRRKRNKKKKAAIKDEVQSMDETPMDTRSTKICLGTDSAMQPQVDNLKMDAGSTENLSEGNMNKKKKKRPKRNKKKEATIMDVVQSTDQTTMDSRSKENLLETDLTTMDTRSKENLLETDLTVQPLADNLKADACSTENLSEGNVNKKKKKRLKRNKKKKATIMGEVQSMDQTTMETRSKENLLEADLTVQQLADKRKTEAGSIENLADGDVQTMDHTAVDTVSTENLAEGNVIGKRKRKKKRNKAQIIDAIQSVDETKTDTGSAENLAEGNVTSKRKRKRKSKKAKNKCTNDMSYSSVSLSKLADKSLDLCKHEETDLLRNVVEGSCYKASSSLAQARSGPLAQFMELEGKFVPCESQHIAHPSLMTEVENEIILYQGKRSAEGMSSFSACNVEASTHFSSCDAKHADCLYPNMAPSVSITRKLLVLDVNGLLADILQPPPKHCRADVYMFGRAIFKRPFCGDFMKFCFQNFDVGIWSSRSRKILNNIVDYLLGGLKHKLLFCWDRARCTQTGFKTLENKHKPLVCKELRKIWDNNDPNLPWKKGDYNESNTLLLDDSPYKALLNPLHTAIFPLSYTYMDENDNSLGPGGNLRVYLEGLLTSENVQTYVEQHPFGQGNIDEKSFSWGFYAGVLHSMEEKKTHIPRIS
ncbi:Phosphoprotein phosphatase [Handroanthus impetiginosus]|uniref:Phosphoprotein phosphatase n=1 Tax=Handroanthus impetiginosus TaxID=429701 RepID=A0A2G9GBF1_9LAMI|nr:Phosphoprotein phosphatase [Handroanthus impetiginosus]